MKASKDSDLAICLLVVGLTMVIFCAFSFPTQARARSDPASALPTLERFIEQVRNGDADALRGAYIPEVLALPVVQQPRGNSNYVSPENSALTQFNMAKKAGNVGLLAHNYLAGRLFFNIQPNDTIVLVYGNARTETFVVEHIHGYEALPSGAYRSIEGQNALNVGSLFAAMYGGERHVTLQTCIAKGDNLNWGRLFVIAKPSDHEDLHILALLDTVVAPPPPPVTQSAAQPALVLGWPLTQIKRNANNNASPAKP